MYLIVFKKTKEKELTYFTFVNSIAKIKRPGKKTIIEARTKYKVERFYNCTVKKLESEKEELKYMKICLNKGYEHY